VKRKGERTLCMVWKKVVRAELLGFVCCIGMEERRKKRWARRAREGSDKGGLFWETPLLNGQTWEKSREVQKKKSATVGLTETRGQGRFFYQLSGGKKEWDFEGWFNRGC